MMNKVEKLLDLAIEIARVYLEERMKATHPMLPFPKAGDERQTGEAVVAVAAEAPAAAAAAPKKPRKAKAAPEPASEVETMTPNPAPAETEEQAIADAAADHQASIEEQEKASYERMMEATKQWVILAKNDTPKDGKEQAKVWLKEFGVEKLTDMGHEQRLAWIAKVEGAIAAHK